MSLSEPYPPLVPAFAPPRAHRVLSEEGWAQVRQEYFAGVSAPELGRRYGVGVSTVREKAKEGGWRRADQAEPSPAALLGPLSPDGDEADEAPLDAAALAELARAQAQRAIRGGWLGGARGWTRLTRELRSMAREEAEAAEAEAESAAQAERKAARAAETANVRAAEQAYVEAAMARGANRREAAFAFLKHRAATGESLTPADLEGEAGPVAAAQTSAPEATPAAGEAVAGEDAPEALQQAQAVFEAVVAGLDGLEGSDGLDGLDDAEVAPAATDGAAVRLDASDVSDGLNAATVAPPSAPERPPLPQFFGWTRRMHVLHWRGLGLIGPDETPPGWE